MKLIEEVTSVSLSNKLKELGVKATSLFYREWNGAGEDEIEFQGADGQGYFAVDGVNCYTASELGEMLPKEIELEDCDVRLSVEPIRGLSGNWEWLVMYYGTRNKKQLLTDKYTNTGTMADAMAKMLIYLLENGLLKLEERK